MSYDENNHAYYYCVEVGTTRSTIKSRGKVLPGQVATEGQVVGTQGEIPGRPRKSRWYLAKLSIDVFLRCMKSLVSLVPRTIVRRSLKRRCCSPPRVGWGGVGGGWFSNLAYGNPQMR